MDYIPSHNAFAVKQQDLQRASLQLLHAIKHIRMMAKLPLTRYKQEGPLESPDHAQKSIIEAARSLGIDFGVDWGEQLDVTNTG